MREKELIFFMRKKIYIADSDRSILEALKIILDNAGYDTETTLNENRLLNYIPAGLDLILLDIQVSNSKGLIVCKHLKSLDATRGIPIIMISAVPELVKLAEEAGANDFLEKPFNIDRLLSIVEKHIGAS